MPISIELCNDEDLTEVFAVISDTFQHEQPIVDAIFPNHDTPAGRTRGTHMLTQMKQNPNFKFLKAIDSETNEILGQATWILLDRPLENEILVGEGWDTEEDKEFSQLLHEQQMRYRIEASRAVQGRLLVLDCLAVRSEHQRKGIGSKLIQWGTKLADELQVEAVVEASMKGAPVYEKHGLRNVSKMQYSMPAKFAGRRTPNLLFMKRVPKEKTVP
ncbi:MAG: hypothetical protein Q9170_004449 [Blastenia crenularia]